MQEVEKKRIPEKVHFTYKADPDMSALCQGDVLKITDELRAVLQEVHPYFLNEQYKFFMVLTQSCDLVRRSGGKCKTPYITLAAIRSFDDLLERLLISGKCAERVNEFLLMDNKSYNRAYQLVERIYNNTEPDYFFLYKEEALGFPESMVVSLKVSIALKSDLHYDQCLAAKVLELSDEFKAKLGWLVGNIYSRVGTTDWESILTSGARAEMLKNVLITRCFIAEKPQISALKSELQRNADQFHSYEDAEAFVASFTVETKYDQVIKEVENTINTAGKKLSAEDRQLLINAIKSKNKLKTLIT